MTDGQGILVIGLGSPLMGDDGAGLAALDRLRRLRLPALVELADGGTWGLNLLPAIESCDRLILVDAVRAGRLPGELVILERDQIPRFLSTKLSPHQIDLREVLALAELRGTLPRDAVVIGIEPDRVELCTDLSPAVVTGLDRVVDAVLERLALWGVPVPTETADA